MFRRQIASIVCLAIGISTAHAFAPTRFAQRTATHLHNDNGGVEQIEFKIYPDGRVEETVRGIRGNNCHKVTEKINEALGEVICSEPTEDMYEQELVVDQTIEQTDGSGSGSGGEWGTSW